jgi:hypothetical protein
MIKTTGQTDKFQGSAPSVSPTALGEGVFSFIGGGVPSRGGFSRLPGKTIRDSGVSAGSAITIYQLGELVVVQRFTGIEIHDLTNLAPSIDDFVYDLNNQLVRNLQGIPITAT